MLIAIGVVENRLLLNRFLGNGEIEGDGSIDGWRGENGQFQSGEGLAGVAICFFCDVLERFLFGNDLYLSESSFLIVNRPF